MPVERILLIFFGILLIFIGTGFVFLAIRIQLRRAKEGEATSALTKQDIKDGWWHRNAQLVLYCLAIVFLMLGIGGLVSLPKIFGS